MEKKPVIAILILACFMVQLQTPLLDEFGPRTAPTQHSTTTHNWVKKISTSLNDEIRDVFVDEYGNTYVAGRFSTTSLSFGSNTIYKGSASYAGYIAKLNGSTWEWAKSIGISGTTVATGITAYDGDIFISGSFTNQMTIGSSTISSNGNTDAFIMSISDTGNWNWAKSIGGTGHDYGIHIASGGGVIFYCGYATGTVSHPNGQTSVNFDDLFISKLTTSGSTDWTNFAGGSDRELCNSIAVDSDSNAYITGFFKTNVVNFGSHQISSSSTTWSDVFTAKINSVGNWQWAKSLQVSNQIGNSRGDDIVVDSEGDVHLITRFRGADIDCDNLGTFNGSEYSYLVASQNTSTGAFTQCDVFDDAMDYKGGIGVDSWGQVYATGSFGVSHFDIDEKTLSREGLADVFLAKRDRWGTWTDVITMGGSSNELSVAMGMDDSDHVVIAGTFQSSQIHINSHTMTNDGNEDVFVIAYDMSMYIGDSDGDGYPDNGDDCPDVLGYSTIDRIGCPDFDQDGYSDPNEDWGVDDGADAFKENPTQHADRDGDGWGDNQTGGATQVDDFPDNPTQYRDSDGDTWGDNQSEGATRVDNFTDNPSQWADTDGDGWGDNPYPATQIDHFILDPTQWSDIDGDGYGDNWNDTDWNQTRDSLGIGVWVWNATTPDYCPTQHGTSTIDVFGCLDSDGDGVSDLNDVFPDDPWETEDSDGDGYGDNEDDCPMIEGYSTKDRVGCPDTDGDGYSDEGDSFHLDPTQWADRDGDGYGDNYYGDDADDCPDEFGTSFIDRLGCLDSDGDGFSDLNDAFPQQSSQWNDTDEDGWGDNQSMDAYQPDRYPLEPTQWADFDNDTYGDNPLGVLPDSCPLEYGESFENEIYGCIDSDGDGYADSIDLFADDPSSWSDFDLDGFSDQEGAMIYDNCPTEYGTSTGMPQGCPDSDGDGVADSVDFKPDDPDFSTEEEWKEHQEQLAEEKRNLLLMIGGGILFVVVLVFALLKIKPKNDEDKWIVDDELFDEIDSESILETTPTESANESNSQSWPAKELSGKLGSDGYEWLEYPEASSVHYYRTTSDEEWSLWES